MLRSAVARLGLHQRLPLAARLTAARAAWPIGVPAAGCTGSWAAGEVHSSKSCWASSSTGRRSAGQDRRQRTTTAAAATCTSSDSNEVLVVYVTVPNREVGKSIGRRLVESKLAACVNIIPGLLSIYQWEGKVHADPEEMLIIKTRSALLPKLTAAVKEAHPYDECEVLALPVMGGSESYLSWVRDSTHEAS